MKARVASLTVALLLLLQTTAAATPPLEERFHFVDGPRVLVGATAECRAATGNPTFVVMGLFEGDVHIQGFFDNDGLIVGRTDRFPDFKTTVWSPTTGKSYTSPSPASLHADFPGGARLGGPAIIAVSGLVEKFDGVDMEGGHEVWEGVVPGFRPSGIPRIQFLRRISTSGPDLDTPVRVARCNAVL